MLSTIPFFFFYFSSLYMVSRNKIGIHIRNYTYLIIYVNMYFNISSIKLHIGHNSWRYKDLGLIIGNARAATKAAAYYNILS